MSSKKSKKRNPGYVTPRECAAFRVGFLEEISSIRERLAKTETRLGVLIVVADVVLVLIVYWLKGG